MTDIYAFGDRQSWDRAKEAITRALSVDIADEARGYSDGLLPIRWGKVVTTWVTSDGNTVVLRPCHSDGTSLGADTSGYDDKTVLIAWPPSASPDGSHLTADTVVPWIPFGLDTVDTDKSGILLPVYSGGGGAATDEKVAAASGDTAGYLDTVITGGDSNDYDGATDVGIAGDTTVNPDEILLYAEMDEVMGWDAANDVGCFGHQSGVIEWFEGIELSAALKLVTGHGNSKTMKTDSGGDPEWVTV